MFITTPEPEVLARLHLAKALTYRTDVDGATSFYWMVRR
jgi:beta-lactamase superfamily II metal-dependent hydrolase